MTDISDTLSISLSQCRGFGDCLTAGWLHFARERLTAFTPWHLDAVSGSHSPHLLLRDQRTLLRRGPRSEIDPNGQGGAANEALEALEKSN